MGWDLPREPWVLHATHALGILTERWLETQLHAEGRYDARLLGLFAQPDVPRERHWLVARDRLDRYLACRYMRRSGGLTALWLAPTFRQEPRPTAVHVHFGPTATELRGLARAIGRPLIASFYGYDAAQDRWQESRLWRRRYAALFEFAEAFVVEGPQMGERLVGLGCPAGKVQVVRLPADAAGLGKVQAAPPDCFRAVLAGRFCEKKGFDVGIKAFARALRGRDAELLILGGGPLEPEYRALVRRHGIEDQVRWGGRLPFGQFMTAVATAGVGLYPSRTAEDGDSEGGAPVTLIEAQWLGIPAIVSAHDDLPFVAAPEAPRLPPTAVGEWADALLALYESPTRLQAMADDARRFSREHHSPEANARGRDAVYDAVSAGSPVLRRPQAHHVRPGVGVEHE